MRSLVDKVLGLLTPKQRRQLGLLCALNALSALVEAASIFSVFPFLRLAGDPDLIRRSTQLRAVYDWGGFDTDAQFIAAAGGVTILAILVMNLVGIVSMWYRTRFCYDVTAEMSARLFRACLGQPYSFILRHNTSVLAKDVLTEVYAFYTNVLDPLTGVLSRGLQSGFVILALTFFDPWMTILAAVVFAAFYSLIYASLQGRLRRLGDERWTTNELRHRLVFEGLNGFREVRLFNREESYGKLFERTNFRNARVQSSMFLYHIIPRYIIEVVVFGALVGAVLAGLRGGNSLADVIPSLAVFAVAGARLMPGIQSLFQYAATLRGNSGGLEKLARLFNDTGAGLIPSAPAASSRLSMTASIHFEGVSYTYPGSERPALVDVSFTVPARGCIGIYGPSGAGKSTVVDLLLGLLTPTRGRILIDGRALDDSVVPGWRRNVGYVPQSVYLADASIAENIGFADPENLDLARVRTAAELAHITDFIDRQPAGLDTNVGERGVRMSGGQRQRLAIARALYLDPEVIVFDEATSALDTDSETAIVEAVQLLSHSKTMIIVAHRRSTLKYCDAILCFEKSRLVRVCSYAELEGLQLDPRPPGDPRDDPSRNRNAETPAPGGHPEP